MGAGLSLSPHVCLTFVVLGGWGVREGKGSARAAARLSCCWRCIWVEGLEDLTRTCGWAVLDVDDVDDDVCGDGCELLCLKGWICVVFVFEFACAGDGHVVFLHTHIRESVLLFFATQIELRHR